jgi:hypothetical protein
MNRKGGVLKLCHHLSSLTNLTSILTGGKDFDDFLKKMHLCAKNSVAAH